jgi:hypothetical protein
MHRAREANMPHRAFRLQRWKALDPQAPPALRAAIGRPRRRPRHAHGGSHPRGPRPGRAILNHRAASSGDRGVAYHGIAPALALRPEGPGRNRRPDLPGRATDRGPQPAARRRAIAQARRAPGLDRAPSRAHPRSCRSGQGSGAKPRATYPYPTPQRTRRPRRCSAAPRGPGFRSRSEGHTEKGRVDCGLCTVLSHPHSAPRRWPPRRDGASRANGAGQSWGPTGASNGLPVVAARYGKKRRSRWACTSSPYQLPSASR